MEFLLILLWGILTLPLLSLGWFAYSLCRYLRTPKSNALLRQQRRSSLIYSAVLLGVSVGLIVALIVFFALAISHM